MVKPAPCDNTTAPPYANVDHGAVSSRMFSYFFSPNNLRALLCFAWPNIFAAFAAAFEVRPSSSHPASPLRLGCMANGSEA